MAISRSGDGQFLKQLTQLIEENLSNEQFGVSDLAREIGMSRSNLLRKVSKATQLSVSQFIRQIRLSHASELLKNQELTVSEVAYRVGFGSPSYFIKCFREQFGYSPGNMPEEEVTQKTDPVIFEATHRKMPMALLMLIPLAVIVLVVAYFFHGKSSSKQKIKSIAVLPFINDSNDSSNVYIINGLMESTLNKLQGIEGLRVISRTSAEKYRNRSKTIPEIASELNVDFIVEGSGQKIDNRIMLNIQLIEARTDNHLWSRQFERQTTDIFELQSEIAISIASEVRVIVTHDEQIRLEKAPTANLQAYDLFLKGIDLLNIPNQTPAKIQESISYLKAAIELDSRFARAYAATAFAYYFFEDNKAVRMYSDSINFYADQALLHDSKLPQSLIAKALFYMSHKEFELALPYFEKALEYNPNYDLVYVFLVDMYVNHIPDTEKYLEYALRGLQIDPASYDSTTNSFNYLHIANAFIQAGFIEEAEKYINKSLDYLPGNLYSEYVKAYILYAKNKDLRQTRELLATTLSKDKYRLDVIQELAKICYFQRDFEQAYVYYQNYLAIKDTLKLAVYPQEDIKIAYTCLQLGKNNEARIFLESYKNYLEQDNTLYKSLNHCIYYCAMGETEKAMEQFKSFTTVQNFHYWTLLFMPVDPLLDELRKQEDFPKYYKKIEKNFNEFHKRVEGNLSKKGLL